MLSLISKFKIFTINPVLIINNITRSFSILPPVPKQIIHEHRHLPVETPPHHNNPEIERLLREELCDYPPYQSRKIKPGFQNAIMIRDYKRRQVSAHFSDVRVRLNAIRKNNLIPKEMKVSFHSFYYMSFKELASLQIASLARDSNWTRILDRCTVTSRRRGCQTRWRISRIQWRLFADYNRMSGVLWANWGAHTRSVRRHMLWPPPNKIPIPEYIRRYYTNLSDDSQCKS